MPMRIRIDSINEVYSLWNDDFLFLVVNSNCNDDHAVYEHQHIYP